MSVTVIRNDFSINDTGGDRTFLGSAKGEMSKKEGRGWLPNDIKELWIFQSVVFTVPRENLDRAIFQEMDLSSFSVVLVLHGEQLSGQSLEHLSNLFCWFG